MHFNFCFCLLLAILIDIASSEIRLKICAITIGIKNYKSIIKKKKKKKTSWNTIKVLISKVLINSCISHNEFVSVNNVLTEYNDMKEAIKNLKIFSSDNV